MASMHDEPTTDLDVPLFDGFEPRSAIESEPGLSAGQRLTVRQAENIAAGVHPLTKGQLHPLASRARDASAPKGDPFTCGSCYFRAVERYHDHSYPKCWLPGPNTSADRPTYPRVTHGAASDVRAWWPACRDYSPGASLSPDAARHIPSEGTA